MKVILQKPHTHAGVNYPAGTTIDVDAGTAQWLAENGVIAAKVTPVTAPEPTKEKQA